MLRDIGLRFTDGDCAVPDLVVLDPDTPRANADYNDVTMVRPRPARPGRSAGRIK